MNRKAFTLLEVLVAMAVLSLMVVLMASIAGKVSKIWQDVSANNQQRAAARVLLHFMARELEAARQPALMPSATNAANLQMFASLTNALNATNTTKIPSDNLNPHALFWQVPAAKNTSMGNIASVGYFIRWDTTSQPGRAKPFLCRFFVGPSDSTNFQIYGQTAQNWLSVIPTVAPATSPAYQGWLSDNVIGLWIRFLDTDGQPITKNALDANGKPTTNNVAGQTMNYAFDSRQGYTSPTTGQIHPAPAYPPCVEIALV
ncbi:MAG: prepilin-type N-terminal cleavage/methylation domain-containing protein, partial [Verrucomicrobiota bacterium]